MKKEIYFLGWIILPLLLIGACTEASSDPNPLIGHIGPNQELFLDCNQDDCEKLFLGSLPKNERLAILARGDKMVRLIECKTDSTFCLSASALDLKENREVFLKLSLIKNEEDLYLPPREDAKLRMYFCGECKDSYPGGLVFDDDSDIDGCFKRDRAKVDENRCSLVTRFY